MLRSTLWAVVALHLFLRCSAVCDDCHCNDSEIRCQGRRLQHPFIKDRVKNSSGLEKIKIVSCELPEINDDDFRGCTSLSSLYISDMNLTSISEFALRDLRSLLTLVIDNAGLKSIPQRLFANNARLETIRLTRNNIETTSPGTFPFNLTELDLSGNNIKTLDFQAYSSKKMILWLLDNPIENVNTFSKPFPKELHLDCHVYLNHQSDLLSWLEYVIHVHFRCTQKYDVVTYVHNRRYGREDARGHEHSNLDESYRQQCLDVYTERFGNICNVSCPVVCDQDRKSTDASIEVSESYSTSSTMPATSSEEKKSTSKSTEQGVPGVTEDHKTTSHEQDMNRAVNQTGNGQENVGNQSAECSCYVQYFFICLSVFINMFLILLNYPRISEWCNRYNDNSKPVAYEMAQQNSSVPNSPQVSPRRRRNGGTNQAAN